MGVWVQWLPPDGVELCYPAEAGNSSKIVIPAAGPGKSEPRPRPPGHGFSELLDSKSPLQS
jgi:hypothetical protein